MNTKETNNSIKIAYCPTMEVFMNALSDMEGLEIIPVSSAGQALFLLKSGTVDAVIIGRRAKRQELGDDTRFLRIKGGYTLVYRQKTGIPVESLKDIEVLTYIDDEKISHISGFFGAVKHLNSLDECLKYGLEIPVVIDWDDYRDDFELLIPVNERGEKVPEFRAPVLYHNGIPETVACAVDGRIKGVQ